MSKFNPLSDTTTRHIAILLTLLAVCLRLFQFSPSNQQATIQAALEQTRANYGLSCESSHPLPELAYAESVTVVRHCAYKNLFSPAIAPMLDYVSRLEVGCIVYVTTGQRDCQIMLIGLR